jgi:hypothetical protein
VANRYLDTSRLTIVIVGDRAAMEPELLALGLPPPVLRGADGEFEPA